MSRKQYIVTDSRRERLHQHKRARITQAAAELFHAQSFRATTTEQIAERADVAKGTLFLYAKTKANLLLLVYEAEIEEAVAEAFHELRADAPVVVTLANLFGHFFRVYERDTALARHFIQELLFASGEQLVMATTERFVVRLSEVIRVWQSEGRVAADVDAILAAQTTFALYYGVLLGWLGGQIPDAATRDELFRRGLGLHWRGLAHASEI